MLQLVSSVKNFIIFYLVLVAMALTNGHSANAQIDGLYDKQSDQIAGVNALMSATVSNDLNGVKFFSKAGSSMINKKNFGGATALHIACRQKNFEIAKFLVENGANVNSTDNEGWTPLMRAALAGDKNIVFLLLDKGAEAKNLNSINESALMHATVSDCDECLDALLKKYDFIKLMDIQILKDQLTKSFVIAGNHDDQIAQKLLEVYLDKVLKTIDQINKEAEERRQVELAAQAKAKEDAAAAVAKELQDKVFKITSDNKGTVSNSEEKPTNNSQQKQSPKFKLNVGKQWEKPVVKNKDSIVPVSASSEQNDSLPKVSEKAASSSSEVKSETKKEEKKSWNLFSIFKSKSAEKSAEKSEENKTGIVEDDSEVPTIYLTDKPVAVQESSASKPVFKLQKGPEAKQKFVAKSAVQDGQKTFKFKKITVPTESN
jgi:ankyrin repeat protein